MYYQILPTTAKVNNYGLSKSNYVYDHCYSITVSPYIIDNDAINLTHMSVWCSYVAFTLDFIVNKICTYLIVFFFLTKLYQCRIIC